MLGVRSRAVNESVFWSALERVEQIPSWRTFCTIHSKGDPLIFNVSQARIFPIALMDRDTQRHGLTSQAINVAEGRPNTSLRDPSKKTNTTH